MILGTKARYAVMAMVDLAGRKTPAPVALGELSDAQEIPLAYLEQIFNKLKKQGLVRSVRGPGGGYALARGAEGIRISEIVMAVDESIKMTRCGEEKKAGGCMASRARCATHDLWDGLGNHIYAYLYAVTLKDVVHRAGKKMLPIQQIFGEITHRADAPVS